MILSGATYQDRVKEQYRLWMNGQSVHNDLDGECCLDFSCCMEGMETPKEERERIYYEKYPGSRN